MKGSLTNQNNDGMNQLENTRAASLQEHVPYIMSKKEFQRYIRKRLPKWIQEVRKLARHKECGKQ